MEKEPVGKKEMTAECDALVGELRALANAIEDRRVNLDLWGTLIHAAFPLKHISWGNDSGKRGKHLIVDLNKMSEAHNQWFIASEDEKLKTFKPSKGNTP